MLLTVEQCKELVEFLQRQMETDIMAYMPENLENECHKEIQSGDLWLSLEQREVIIPMVSHEGAERFVANA